MSIPLEINYSTKTFSEYLLALAKMIQPKLFLELGTGLGQTSLAMAQVCKVITYDNGSEHESDYKQVMQNKFKGLNVEFKHEDINLNKINCQPDIVFSDFLRRTSYINDLLNWCIKHTTDEMILFIDGGATWYDCRSYLDTVIPMLNNNKPPNCISNPNNYEFIVDHILKKNYPENQNSFTYIKIKQRNIML